MILRKKIPSQFGVTLIQYRRQDSTAKATGWMLTGIGTFLGIAFLSAIRTVYTADEAIILTIFLLGAFSLIYFGLSLLWSTIHIVLNGRYLIRRTTPLPTYRFYTRSIRIEQISQAYARFANNTNTVHLTMTNGENKQFVITTTQVEAREIASAINEALMTGIPAMQNPFTSL